jgi:hypothetical protein
MTHREFTDQAGVAWEAWEAHPTLIERRCLRDRRKVARDTPERRTMNTPMSASLQDSRGWLAFRSAFERRRTPIPARWEELSDAGLRTVLNGSRLAGRIRRPVDPYAGVASAFSAGALEQLQHALDAELTQPGGKGLALQVALERLCTEAHALRFGPEKMIVGVKAVWDNLKRRPPIDEDRKCAAFGRVLRACIHTYYG